jgi:hypothetical protein
MDYDTIRLLKVYEENWLIISQLVNKGVIKFHEKRPAYNYAKEYLKLRSIRCTKY